MSFWSILLLAVVQGLAELLPVSSSAHVVVTEKLLGLDPSSPSMTLFLIMLHTGTMFAVIVYFWRQWRATYLQNMQAFKKFVGLVLIASFLSGLVGLAIIKIIEGSFFSGEPHAQIEDLFSHLEIIAPALALVGLLILWAGIVENKKSMTRSNNSAEASDVQIKSAAFIGMVQGLSLPFRGFSRSGSTISVGMLLGVAKANTERFSFALAVALTPVLVAREGMRLVTAEQLGTAGAFAAFLPGLLGACFAFLAGLVALKWLSGWLESGRWYLFGIYCLIASVVVGYLHHLGY